MIVVIGWLDPEVLLSLLRKIKNWIIPLARLLGGILSHRRAGSFSGADGLALADAASHGGLP
ncbi:hypothetical protein [Rhodoferax sp.]